MKSLIMRCLQVIGISLEQRWLEYKVKSSSVLHGSPRAELQSSRLEMPLGMYSKKLYTGIFQHKISI